MTISVCFKRGGKQVLVMKRSRHERDHVHVHCGYSAVVIVDERKDVVQYVQVRGERTAFEQGSLCFLVHMRILWTNALRQVKLDAPGIIGPQPIAACVQQNLEATVEISLQRNGEVARNGEREKARPHPFQQGLVQDPLSFEMKRGFLHGCFEARCLWVSVDYCSLMLGGSGRVRHNRSAVLCVGRRCFTSLSPICRLLSPPLTLSPVLFQIHRNTDVRRTQARMSFLW